MTLGKICILAFVATLMLGVSDTQAQGWNTEVAGQVTTSGKVGIGTTTPVELLHVSGNVRLSSGRPFLSLSNTNSDGAAWSIISGTAGSFFIAQDLAPVNDANVRLAITNTGNVGLGTLAPNARLEVNGQLIARSSYASYTPDGLWSAQARPSRIIMPMGQELRFGYHDGGTGQYYPAIGFGVNSSAVLDDLGIIQSRVVFGTAEAYNRFVVTGGGKMKWGTGSAAEDTSLFRDAPNTLRTSGTFLVGGRLGVGTSTAGTALEIVGNTSGITGGAVQISSGVGAGTTLANQVNITNASGSWGLIAGFNGPAVPPYGYHQPNGAHLIAVQDGPLTLGTRNLARLTIAATGAVGIGTNVPSTMLDVVGTIRARGDITADGIIYAKYQDVAEWVPAASDLPPGTVVVLNPDHENEVMASHSSYDTHVAGVVSPQPGLVLGEAGSAKEMIATTGRVRVKVDATGAPIAIGDLLVTSDRTGVAMRSTPVDVGGVTLHRPGTILGKALQPLASGTGEILVLLSLQ